jgi:diguanylate cyclase (GGDEF)-like protein/PAS domain S-box-containing protein
MELIQGKPEGVAQDKAGGAYAEHTANFLPGILENSDDFFAAVDPELRLVAFNAAFRRGITVLSKSTPQLGQCLDEVLTDFPSVSHTVIELCRKTFAGEALRLPLEFVQGSDLHRYFDATFSPVRDPGGVVVIVGVVLRDVTEWRVTELKLQGILEATPDALLVMREGVIEFANSQLERMFGYAKGALVGVPLDHLFPEQAHERRARQRISFERPPKTCPMGVWLNLRGLKADGSELPVEISLSPLEINGQGLVIAAVRDISARAQVESELHQEVSDLRRQLAIVQRRQGIPSELEIYRVSFEQAAAALFHYGPDGRIKRVNDYFCHLMGYRREELLQLTVQKIAHPADAQVNTDLDIKLLAGALHQYRIDKRLVRKDGKALWVRIAVSLQRTAQGEPDNVIAVAEDITEHKRTEAKLQETQLRLTMAAEIAKVGYAEFVVESKKTFLSPELKRQLGYADADLPNAFREWTRRLHQEDRERVLHALQSPLFSQTRTLDIEYRLRHRDGQYRWFLGRGITLEDFPGHATKLLFTQIDITERKEAERRLREQAEELQLALRVGRSGSFQWNVQSHEHHWSDESFSLYGLKPEDFGGGDQDWLTCLLPEDREAVIAAIDHSLTTGTYAAEFRIRRGNDGAIRWISGRGQVFFDEHGSPSRMIGINVDVTEQKHIQTELEESKARLEAVLDSLKEGVVIVDLAGKVVDVNPAAREILHYQALEDAGHHILDFADAFDLLSLDGDIIPVKEWPRNRVLRGESLTDFEFMLRSKDNGETFVISCNGAAVRDANGDMILGVLTIADVSARKRAEQALQDSERRLALALQAGNSAVWEVDVAAGKLLPVSDLLFTMLGYTPGELNRLDDWLRLIHDEDRSRILQILDDVVQGRQDGYSGVELRYRSKDGGWRWILCQAVAAERDRHGKALRLVGTHTDIHDRKLAEQRAQEAVQHDLLTGLPGRALVFEYGSHLLAAAQRQRGRVALLFIDLDRFKPINDQYGHKVGDKVLQVVAARLVNCTRHEDLVGRLGGDEFVIILPHLDAGRRWASVVAQKIIDSISQPVQVESLDLVISPSIGISYYPEHARNVEDLVRTADLAMYQAKQSGRANYQVYTDRLDRNASAMYQLEARLKNAIKHGGMALHYQPIVDVKTGALIGAEALARLPVDDGKICSPEAFIPIAESSGLIGELGDWVAAEACRQHEAWRRDGMLISMAINVSPLQFRQRTFPERLGRIIAGSGIDPSSLQLEVTESTVMENVDEAVEILNRVKALGVKVALDDFGTGYSSLSRLSRLPLDKLKVDQSFMLDIEKDATSRAITEAIIALGRNLRLEVIGEGIESEDAMRYLEEHGCQQAQGFWISEPLPASEFAKWYRERAVH